RTGLLPPPKPWPSASARLPPPAGPALGWCRPTHPAWARRGTGRRSGPRQTGPKQPTGTTGHGSPQVWLVSEGIFILSSIFIDLSVAPIHQLCDRVGEKDD